MMRERDCFSRQGKTPGDIVDLGFCSARQRNRRCESGPVSIDMNGDGTNTQFKPHIGAVPFGMSFALLWWVVPVESQLLKFAYYTAVYTLLSVAMTVVAVPYLSLQPEMATGYDARTRLNAFRNAFEGEHLANIVSGDEAVQIFI